MTIHNPHLDGRPFYWQAGPDGILLVHGFTATVAEVRPLAERLHAAGYTVAGPLLPGHYTRPEDLNQVRWQDWVQVCEETYRRLQSDCRRVVVGGESTGAVLSLYLGLHHPEIAALLLYAPALRLNMTTLDEWRMRLAAAFIRWMPKQHMDSNPLWQGYPVNPLKGALQLLALQRQVAPRLAEIHQPVFIMQGRLDKTVHPSVPDQISGSGSTAGVSAAGVSSEIVEKYWMEKSGHCVIIDRELDQATQLTLMFLNRVLAPERQTTTSPTQP